MKTVFPTRQLKYLNPKNCLSVTVHVPHSLLAATGTLSGNMFNDRSIETRARCTRKYDMYSNKCLYALKQK